jgi:hypothetical protein
LEQQGVVKSLPHKVSIREIQIVGSQAQWLESRWIKEVHKRDLEPFDLAWITDSHRIQEELHEV